MCDSLKNAAVFLRETDKAMSSFSEKNGNVAGTPIPTSAKTMSDASTDMELTQAYWDSLAARTAADSRQRRQKPPIARRPSDTEADTGTEMVTEDETVMDTDAVGSWADVVGRRRRRRMAPAPAIGTRSQGSDSERHEEAACDSY